MGIVLFVLLAIISTIYLALALAICIAVLLLVYWLATKLMVMLTEGDERPPPPARGPSRPTQRRRSR